MSASMQSLVDQVLDISLRSEWAQANRELALAISKSYADLYIRMLQGQDVTKDLAVVKASLMSLGSAAASTGASAIEDAIWRAVSKGITLLMTA